MATLTSSAPTVALVGAHPPTACRLATFTSNLASAKPAVANRFALAQELLSSGAASVVPRRDFRATAATLERVPYQVSLGAPMTAAARRKRSALLCPSISAAYRRPVEATLATTTTNSDAVVTGRGRVEHSSTLLPYTPVAELTADQVPLNVAPQIRRSAS